MSDEMSDRADVVIVGAGPYGLSIAAHLKALGLRVRTFGSPMRTWREHMPAGMFLKSDGFASNLSDPDGTFTLRQYCQESGADYDATRTPVPLATFQAYGLAFQKRFVPDLDTRDVVHIDTNAVDSMDQGRGFRVQLEDGEIVLADRVILAVGISHFDYVPPVLAGLPERFVTHSAKHSSVEKFGGRNVTVLGAGASALDLAALLYETGANVQLLANTPALKFLQPPSDAPRTLWQQLRHPSSGLGPGLRSRFYTDAPVLFHHLPEKLRLKLVRKHLGASGGYTVKDVVMRNVKLLLRQSIKHAEVRNEILYLQVFNGTGRIDEMVTDHVIAATGYRPDLRRLDFLSEAVRKNLASVENTPKLSSYFESSIPGLYFTGLIAANSFGPLLRFAHGADFTARRVAERMAKVTRAGAQPAEVPVEEAAEPEPALQIRKQSPSY